MSGPRGVSGPGGCSLGVSGPGACSLGACGLGVWSGGCGLGGLGGCLVQGGVVQGGCLVPRGVSGPRGECVVWGWFNFFFDFFF